MQADRTRLIEEQPAAANQPSMNVLLADSEEVQNTASALVHGRAFGIGKRSNAPIQGALVNQASGDKNVIKTLRRYLLPEDNAAIVTAYAIMRLEDGQTDFTSVETLRRAKDKYFANDTERRQRVYNRCRSGYTRDILYELAMDMEADARPKAEIARAVREAWNTSLALAPLDIYVSADMAEDTVPMLIREKLTQRPLVRVYARGKKWANIIGHTMLYAQANGLRWHQEDHPIGLTRAGCCRLWKPEFGDQWPPIERDLEAALRHEFAAAS